MHRHFLKREIVEAHRGASVAMGNFDGVHIGHQSVIEIARKAVEDAPLGVVTFEPHPRSFFAPDAPPFRLMNSETRAHRLAKMGVEHLYEVPFDKALSSLSAVEFVRDILAGQLGIRHLVVGSDFRFGKERSGDIELLQKLGPQHGFGVSIAELVSEADGAVSSTAIRAALAEGKPQKAAAMLGHWHRYDGLVEHGEKLGRKLGYPTANLNIDGLHLPRFGVYAVFFDVLSGAHKGNYLGAASLGVRPMFGENTPNLETFVLDFSGDLYGAEISVALVDFIRPEKNFGDVAALQDQMKKDVEACRTALAATPKP